MAPTEILVQQHLENLRLLEIKGVVVDALTEEIWVKKEIESLKNY